MSGPTLRALVMDALYQVLDNKVFRILMIVAFAFVAFTFLVGFTEDEIVLLFGWQRFSTLSFLQALSSMGGGGPVPIDLESVEIQKLAIQTIQGIVVNGLAGSLGMMLAISATAFFVPRMLEKGAADTLYSKPVSRLLLFMSRYLAGLLFVALLATFLVVGMHVGFTLVSGYSDSGALWGIVTMTYVFALVHTVSMLVGVVTRSTVASILVTLIFFMGNGCVHGGWAFKEYMVWEQERLEALVRTGREEAEDAGVAQEEAEEEEDEGKEHAFMVWSLRVLDAAHYTLPKTGDADLISDMLREAVIGVGPEYFDTDTGLTIEELGTDFETDASPSGLDGAFPEGLEIGPPLFSGSQLREAGDGRVVLYRRERLEVPFRDRTRAERISDTANALVTTIEADPALALISNDRSQVDGRTSWRVEWSVNGAGGEQRCTALLFHGPPDQIYHLAFGAPLAGRDEDALAEDVEAVLSKVSIETASFEQNPGAWYAEQFSWTADELRFNAWFSIGTSSAFGAVLLLLGWWRLTRIDF